MERYDNIKKNYDLKGENHEVYYHGNISKLNTLTDNELDEYLVYLKRNHKDLKKFYNKNVFLANIENVEDYILKKQRIEKLVKITDNINNENR